MTGLQPGVGNSVLLQKVLLTSLDSSQQSKSNDPGFEPWEANLESIKFNSDEVVRVMDPNTVKLKSAGLVSFAMVRTPSGYNESFRFPDCMAKSPVSKVKQLLPNGTKVKVKIIGESNGDHTQALIVLKSSEKLVNAELVREGFARPITRGRDITERIIPGLSQGLTNLQRQAEAKGIGMYQKCDLVETAADDQFESLDFIVETQYGVDGGKQIIKQREEIGAVPPNPGDIRKCADFEYFEDALRWYDRYFPFYGDVAKLDRDGDGVPCSGLPHTTDQTRYRMKKPSASSVKINTN